MNDSKRSTWDLNKLIDTPTSLNLMYLPALALFAIFIFYPLVQGITISFTNWNGYSPDFSWVGWAKYGQMFADSKTYHTIKNTLIYGLGSTLIQNTLGLAYALLLNNKIRGKNIIRTIIYFPIIISPLIMGYILYFFFQYDGGAINDILLWLNLEPFDWLGNGELAVWIITMANSYQYVGISMIIFLAGLQSIPRECQEAASIDGASGVKRFLYVTLPLLMPAITVSIVINIIGGLKLFDIIIAMTYGGPGYASHSLSTMIADLFFARQDAGFAAALGNLMFIMISSISISVLFFLRKREVEL
jgi:raffinose/stachyose/melibiose transport system permease protein